MVTFGLLLRLAGSAALLVGAQAGRKPAGEHARPSGEREAAAPLLDYSEACAEIQDITVCRNPYDKDFYCCRHFARDFCREARKRGMGCRRFEFGCQDDGMGAGHAIALIEVAYPFSPRLRKFCLVEPQNNAMIGCWVFGRGDEEKPPSSIIEKLQEKYERFFMACNGKERYWRTHFGDDAENGGPPDGTFPSYACRCPGDDFVACGFDEAFYLKKYPDVAAAVRAGRFASGLDHFRRHGRSEHRKKRPPFDESFYLRENPDVEALVREGRITSAFAHFRDHGVCEGRKAGP